MVSLWDYYMNRPLVGELAGLLGAFLVGMAAARISEWLKKRKDRRTPR